MNKWEEIMGEVRRVYVEKKKDYAVKAKELHAGISLATMFFS